MHARFVFTSLAAAAALFASTGCVSLSTMQTASTVGAGKTEIALEPSMTSIIGPFLPHANIAMRYGVTDRVDIGGRVGSSLFDLEAKFLLTDPASPSLALSLAPTVGGFLVGDGASAGGLVNITVPLLIGLKTGGGSELVLGPKLVDLLAFAGAADGGLGGNILALGGTVGYAANFNGFKIIPEVAVAFPLLGAGGISAGGQSASAMDTFSGGLVLQFGVGLVFGGQ